MFEVVAPGSRDLGGGGGGLPGRIHKMTMVGSRDAC